MSDCAAKVGTQDWRLLAATDNKKPAHVNDVHGILAGACYARRPQNGFSIRQFSLLSARAVFWAHLRAAA